MIEIIDEDEVDFMPDSGTIIHKFTHTNFTGEVENLMACLHFSLQEPDNEELDKEFVIENVLKPCAKWYSDYSDWEDENIIKDYAKRK